MGSAIETGTASAMNNVKIENVYLVRLGLGLRVCQKSAIETGTASAMNNVKIKNVFLEDKMCRCKVLVHQLFPQEDAILLQLADMTKFAAVEVRANVASLQLQGAIELESNGLSQQTKFNVN